jgi:hypothetical protein
MRRAGTRRLVGEKIRLDGLPYVIVGVPQDTPGWGMRQLNTSRAVFVPVSNSLCTFDDAGIAQPLASSSGSVRLTDGLTPPPPCGRSSRAQQGLHKQFTCKPCLYRPRGSIQCIITSGNRRLQLISESCSTPKLIIVVLQATAVYGYHFTEDFSSLCQFLIQLEPRLFFRPGTTDVRCTTFGLPVY